MSYASNTAVPAERSRSEIERLLVKHGADDFSYTSNAVRALVAFRMNDRLVRFTMPFPPREDFRRTPHRRELRSQVETDKAWEQAKRAKWRSLLLVVKAKLEAVSAGIVSFETEFLAHIVVPGTGETVFERVASSLAEAYEKGRELGPLLLGPGEG